MSTHTSASIMLSLIENKVGTVMLVFDSQPETLPLTISTDASSGLPLLSEADALLQYILAYLALPYSVTEHGCGDKTSLIINHLLSLDIPPHALSRGMILERDLSPAALAACDYRERKHAMYTSNPLGMLGELNDPDLRDMLKHNLPALELLPDHQIRIGSYLLHHSNQVQFVNARSHIYPILLFWDAEQACTTERIINPSLHATELFPVAQMRDLLHAPEALLLQAPLLGHFRLDETRLTEQQTARVREYLEEVDSINTLSHTEHAHLVRHLTGAEAGSLGDPETWNYANNYQSDGLPAYQTIPEATPAFTDEQYQQYLTEKKLLTGRGDPFVETRRRLKIGRAHV